MNKLDSNLKELEKADVVAFGGVGFAGQILPVTKAYDAVARQLSEEVRPKLERLVERATPAGKVYAATLLDRLDPVAGEAAWKRLARDRSGVNTFTGCIKAHTTLAEYASRPR